MKPEPGNGFNEYLLVKNGKRFIVIHEDKYKSLIETMYLLSSPKNKKQLEGFLNEPIENCKDFNDIINE